jgi:acyl-coenzyme A synthetase/AMP-(fatty) acid ligase
MDSVADLFHKMENRGEEPAVAWRGSEYSYRWLLQNVDTWQSRLEQMGTGRGTVCGIMGEYSPETCAASLALIKIGAIFVPFTHQSSAQMPTLARLAGVQSILRFDEHDEWSVEFQASDEQNELIMNFRECLHPGLVVFTSGSTGEPKGILHDCERVLQKFMMERPGYRTLMFLLADHFGGFNTLMSVLSYGGTAVVAANRSPEEVCRTVESGRVELLPVTPTFLNLLLASRCYKDFDLSSVKLITYGTEVMPDTTLSRIPDIFPSARLQQTYGLSELGVLRSRSKQSNSTWVKVGGPGFETKIVDGRLFVRSQSAMVGYLNAPDPFDADGWMDTGDMVELDGDYLRVLGRQSEIINVGGQKVFPSEVETVLLQADQVVEATIFGTPNSLMGNIITARVSLEQYEDPAQLKARLRRFCLERLAPFKVPVRFTMVQQEDQHNERLKKIRPVTDQGT